MPSKKIPITVAEGDGIGPEIMAATLKILLAAGAPLEIIKVAIGEQVYLKGERNGIEPSSWEAIRNTKAFLKAPITTPQGGGFKSLNVTIRTTLGLYANIRPCVSYYPFVETKHPNMDVVIVRENEEDLYTGIEYRQSQGSYHALKIMTVEGCRKIVRYAFEYAKKHGRKKVTCFTKDNILKLTDGLFHKIYDEISLEYPEIEKEHWIIDIGAAKLADTPTAFDIIVMPNLYGDILSDIAAQIAGSVGLAGSANIGPHHAMFEAIHGSAPRRAGQNVANPSGLLLAAVMMLVHLSQFEAAENIHNSWLKTVEEGIHTYDIFKEGVSKQKVGTKEFADAVIKNLGQKPSKLKPVKYGEGQSLHSNSKESSQQHSKVAKELIGLDVFLDSHNSVEEIQKRLCKLETSDLKLKMISNRGVSVWPKKMPETTCSDSWRCRFMSPNKGQSISHLQLVELLNAFAKDKIDFTHVENLYTFDGQAGYTLSQDEQ